MRATSRLLVTAKYLTPGAPTGLTGVFTHSAPRTTLLYLYNSTLDKLKKFPDHSVYRQSVEALTKHRLSIVESVKPAGLEEWQTRVRPIVDAHPQAFRTVPSAADPSFVNIVFKRGAVKDIDTEAYGDELLMKPQPEGPRVRAEKKHQAAALMRNFAAENAKIPQIEPEPRLTADQVETIEQQVGAGLLEEIIAVAEGEHKLVDTMLENEVWADLIETPEKAQWGYHEIRTTHVPETQAP